MALFGTPSVAASDPAAAGQVRGTWTGALTRDGEDLDVSIRIADSAGGPAATLSARDFRAVDIPLQNVRLEDGRLAFDLVGDASTTHFTGRLTGNVIAGAIDENGRGGTFRLVRRSTAGEAPCEERPAKFTNGEVTLQGALLRPRDAKAKLPAVLLMHGSGPESRAAGRFLATALCEGGAAALIYDKRGVGGSTGDWRGAGFDDLAGDAEAGLAWLAGQPDVDRARLGVYGHSQGGAIAPLVANRSPYVAFVIAGAGAGIVMREVERFSLWNAVRPLTRDAADAVEARVYIDRLVGAAATGEGVAEFIAGAPRFSDRPWFEVVAPPPETAGYWRSARASFNYDPADEWRQVRQPALLIYGERDERTPVERSAAAIRAAAAAGGRPAPRIEVLPGAGHAFDLQTDSSAWPRVAPGYPDLIVEYVTAFRP
jgi:dipeptidyl aminopeptidase/acylaminoacyl peptidase